MSKEIKDLENLRNGVIVAAGLLLGGFMKKKYDEKKDSQISEKEILRKGNYKLVKEEKIEKNKKYF